MTLRAGTREGHSGRNPGQVRIGGVAPTGEMEVQPPPEHSDLVVTGEDLSVEFRILLESVRPQIRVRFSSRDATLEALDESSFSPEIVVVACDLLDTTNLAWIRRIVATAHVPVIVTVPSHPAHRAGLRTRAQEVGAIDCLLREELSIPLVEAAVAHARNHSQQHSRLLDLRERFALAIRGARDGMWEWDMRRNRVFFSQRWRDLVGVRNDQIRPVLDTWFDRVHPQDLARLHENLEAHVNGLIPVHEDEHRVRRANGTWQWVLSRGIVHRDPKGNAVRMAGSLTDISPYRQRERAIREQSRHDSATKLPGRAVLLERLARGVEVSRAHEDYVFIVLLLAVDRLAQIRDSFGVEVAEEIVALMAKRLQGCLRPEDQMFRFSRGKFAIYIDDVDDPSFGTHVANRIHLALNDPFELGGTTTYATVSIGMTSSAHGYQRVEDIITDVSAATDTARDRGRNRHEIYDTSMRIESRTLLAIEMALHQAIDDDQFELHYQPIVDSDSGETQAFEALLRWQHPERGRISPAEFIPVAEDTGLIIQIGRWVIREAVRTLHGWHEEFDSEDLSVSVNLSAKQIGDPLLLDTIDEVLSETGLPPRCLKLELTESVMMDRVDEVTAVLQEIRDRGVSIWIDDFGTGYSSLGYLHRFPVDGLKIDRAFVEPLDGTPQSETIVRTILGLAENLDLMVVAEGIETKVQAEVLRRLGCTRCQGWLFGRPQNAATTRKWIKDS